ncbi:MAG: hypothetical protein JRI93_10470 [Deltaproteobacteria bacterium]|nr:hypothetical protein [Deltaproteobacteria bacterium]
MKSLAIFFTTLSFMIVVCATAFAGADFRCGNTWAEEGKTQSAEIFISCGEPKLKQDLYVLYFEGGLLVKIEVP